MSLLVARGLDSAWKGRRSSTTAAVLLLLLGASVSYSVFVIVLLFSTAYLIPPPPVPSLFAVFCTAPLLLPTLSLVPLLSSSAPPFQNTAHVLSFRAHRIS